VQLWRLCKQKHQNTAFSGDGGLYAPGRWHPKGFPIIYTASSLALATLEVFVHTESDKIPLVAIRAFIPDDAVIRLLAEVRQQATGNRQQWEELEFFGIKLI
jgi:RES domain-containing protein